MKALLAMALTFYSGVAGLSAADAPPLKPVPAKTNRVAAKTNAVVGKTNAVLNKSAAVAGKTNAAVRKAPSPTPNPNAGKSAGGIIKGKARNAVRNQQLPEDL